MDGKEYMLPYWNKYGIRKNLQMGGPAEGRFGKKVIKEQMWEDIAKWKLLSQT